MSLLHGEPVLRGKTVLVIEDVTENMRLFHVILSMEAAQVLEARDGQEGIEIARSEQPDLILMDMQLPGIDGFAAARLLREDARTQGIPIFFLTASAMEEDRLRAFEAGCDGYITKPIDPTRFVRQIADFFQDLP
jgi:two-component system cell cycle response regulator DivK